MASNIFRMSTLQVARQWPINDQKSGSISEIINPFLNKGQLFFLKRTGFFKKDGFFEKGRFFFFEKGQVFLKRTGFLKMDGFFEKGRVF